MNDVEVVRGQGRALTAAEFYKLAQVPPEIELKAKRDRAILATLAYHGLRREELCKLTVRDLQRRAGVLQFRVEGKGEKVRYVPVGMKALRLITEYLEVAGHKADLEGPLFRPVQNRVTGELRKALHPVSVYQDIVKQYGQQVGITADVRGFCVRSLRATAATNALAHGADIAKVQEWPGHADISTTRVYDRRRWRPEDGERHVVEVPILDDTVVVHSTLMREVLDLVARIAPSDANVLLTGESGVGK
ncbi:MAG TPA: tyrosine-type recombinase/integrase, partial [Candidatus Binatia bacterium]|nr:tyrosine-type recombinase/integrase [Candidatus Binatia bacterium]